MWPCTVFIVFCQAIKDVSFSAEMSFFMLLKKVLQPVNALYPWSPQGGAVTLRSRRKVILQNKCSTSINVFVIFHVRIHVLH